MSRQGSQEATTPKVSIGTVELRPQVTRNDRWRGLSEKCFSTSPPTKVRSSSTLEPRAGGTGGRSGLKAPSASRTKGGGTQALRAFGCAPPAVAWGGTKRRAGGWGVSSPRRRVRQLSPQGEGYW